MSVRAFAYDEIPPYVRSALGRYLKLGLRPGDFTYSVLTNNLRSACFHADEDSLRALFLIVAFLHNRFPAMAWGSREATKEWMALPQEKRDEILRDCVQSSTLRLIGLDTPQSPLDIQAR